MQLSVLLVCRCMTSRTLTAGHFSPQPASFRLFSLACLPCRVHSDNPHFPRLLLLAAVQKPDAGVDGDNMQLMLLMSLIGCA